MSSEFGDKNKNSELKNFDTRIPDSALPGDKQVIK
jgi:hypothetical protein